MEGLEEVAADKRLLGKPSSGDLLVELTELWLVPLGNFLETPFVRLEDFPLASVICCGVLLTWYNWARVV